MSHKKKRSETCPNRNTRMTYLPHIVRLQHPEGVHVAPCASPSWWHADFCEDPDREDHYPRRPHIHCRSPTRPFFCTPHMTPCTTTGPALSTVSCVPMARTVLHRGSRGSATYPHALVPFHWRWIRCHVEFS